MEQVILILIFFLVLCAILAALFVVLKKPLAESLVRGVEERMRDERTHMETQLQHTLALAEEKMKKEEQFIESRKDAIKELVDKIHQELVRTQESSAALVRDHAGQFGALKGVLEEYKVLTSGLKESTDNLRNLLSHNQLRGKYGQEVAENLLRSVGFVKGQHYVVEQTQDSAATRPDFTIILPDKTKIHVDVKFPLDALLRYQDAQSEADKERFLKEFASDVRQKIREVTTRDYINPAEQTVDFVILFVPNEMVFSFIYDRLHEVWNDAMQKKVIMAGPFSFTGILRMVFQAYKSFTWQQNIRATIGLLRQFETEYEKYSKEFEKLGTRLQATAQQYESVATTRTKKLTSIVEKIKGADVLPEIETPEQLQSPDSHDDAA